MNTTSENQLLGCSPFHLIYVLNWNIDSRLPSGETLRHVKLILWQIHKDQLQVK